MSTNTLVTTKDMPQLAEAAMELPGPRNLAGMISLVKSQGSGPTPIEYEAMNKIRVVSGNQSGSRVWANSALCSLMYKHVDMAKREMHVIPSETRKRVRRPKQSTINDEISVTTN